MAQRYQVQGHPTLVLTTGQGEAAWTRPGVTARDDIVAAIEDVLR